MRAAVGRLVSFPAGSRGGLGCADNPIDRRPLQQPARFLLLRARMLDVPPRHMVRRRRARGFHRRFVVADDREKIAVPYELDRRLGGAPDRRLVDRFDARAAIGLAYHARMRHAVERHVVDEGLRAEYLGGQVDARGAGADDLVGRGRLAGRPAGGIRRKIDGGSQRPIVVPGRDAVAVDCAVAHRQLRPAHTRAFRLRAPARGRAPRRRPAATRRRQTGSTGCRRCSPHWGSGRYRPSGFRCARAQRRVPRLRSAASPSERPDRVRPGRSRSRPCQETERTPSAPSFGLSAKGPGMTGAVIGPSPRACARLPFPPRAGCGCASRSGRCCRRAPARSPRATATGCCRAAPSPKSKFRRGNSRTGQPAPRERPAATGVDRADCQVPRPS